MPLFSGLSAHSDNKHILSAKRNMPGGVAGLDDTTKIVLAQIPNILTGKDADTLDGKHYAQVTTDIGAHATLTKTHGVKNVILGSEEKNAINGIAALDANAQIMLPQIPNILTGKDADTVDGKHYAQVTTDIGAHAALTSTHGVSGTILGSEDKNAVNGIAGLDANAKIALAQIPNTLTGKDADTVDGKHYAQVTTDIGAHATLTKTHGVSQTILGSEEKNAVNGIAALDANAKIAYAQLPNLTPRINNGYYIGDDTANRPIAHGLGIIPKLVITMGSGGTSGATLINMAGDAWQEASTHLARTTKTWDNTNFYVEDGQTGGNVTGEGYHWVAFG